ncbi:CpaF family protein [Antribacter gilvus]|uniref:CpaF family protein n=1 Tax=Antribacter gilvus TaxID=2304675 RepID=UPI001F0CD167|nr:ATPase, T2SS/T4P/T4SS family [Antribacter gilvus]
MTTIQDPGDLTDVDLADADFAGVDPADVPFLRTPAPLEVPTAAGRTKPDANPWSAAAPAPARAAGPGSPFGDLTPAAEGVIRLGPPVDWGLVQLLRTRVSERLSHVVSTASPAMSARDKEQAGKDIIVDLIGEHVADQVASGRPRPTAPAQQGLARAAFDMVFRLGRLQPLIEDDRVENILVFGHDRVILELTDGTLVPGLAVADSDEELVEFVSFLSSRSESSARAFSEASPELHLRLDDGSRLTAIAWVTPRPQLRIRRHRLVVVDLDDLVRLDLMPRLAAGFLAAAVRQGLSIVVSGSPGSGKTTVVRGLCAEIDPDEQIVTAESEAELFLQERLPYVLPIEARQGTGEYGPDGRQAGEYTLMQAVMAAVRLNVQRTIVGEVRGPEALPLLLGMQNGTGSISTTHARDAGAVIPKLVNCAQTAGPQYSHATLTDAFAATIDLVVHLQMKVVRGPDGTKKRVRRVAEIVAVEPGDSPGTPATTHVFKAGPDGVLRPHVLPDPLRVLATDGFDLAAFTAEQEVS